MEANGGAITLNLGPFLDRDMLLLGRITGVTYGDRDRALCKKGIEAMLNDVIALAGDRLQLFTLFDGEYAT